MKKDLQIPQDLRLPYRWWKKDLEAGDLVTVPTAGGIELIERIARLEEELASLKAQAPGAPTCSIIGSGIPSRYGHRTW